MAMVGEASRQVPQGEQRQRAVTQTWAYVCGSELPPAPGKTSLSSEAEPAVGAQTQSQAGSASQGPFWGTRTARMGQATRSVQLES